MTVVTSVTASVSLKQIEQAMHEQEVREMRAKVRRMIALSFTSLGFSLYQGTNMV